MVLIFEASGTCEYSIFQVLSMDIATIFQYQYPLARVLCLEFHDSPFHVLFDPFFEMPLLLSFF